MPTEHPITINEILENLTNRNTTGRNTWGRGIRGDIEDVLGWHLDDLSESPLSQRDRIATLALIRDTEYLSSETMDRSDLKEFVVGKIREISIDEANLYLRERATTPDLSESQNITDICHQLDALEQRRLELFAGTQKRFGDGPLTDREMAYDKTVDDISDLKVELYNHLAL